MTRQWFEESLRKAKGEYKENKNIVYVWNYKENMRRFCEKYSWKGNDQKKNLGKSEKNLGVL